MKIEDICNAAGLIALMVVLIVAGTIGYGLWVANRVAKPGRILVHVPAIWTISSLQRSASTVKASHDGLNWYPARPWAALGGLRYRLRCAWLAFSGRCDLVRWPEGQ
jgi:hypothetical protein